MRTWISFKSMHLELMFHDRHQTQLVGMTRKEVSLKTDPTHYRNRRLCRVPEALGKSLKTLGKVFAECRTRQRGLGTQCIDKAFFAEYFFAGTRQRGLPSARKYSTKKSSRHGTG
jgi:hypothetical protein